MASNTLAVVSDTIAFLEDHLAQPLSLDKTAKALHYSKYHLHRLFAQTVGIPLHQYLQRRRLTQGARLLAETDWPVLEVALAVGYESQQAFSALFKAMYKSPPAQARRQGLCYPLQLPLTLEPLPAGAAFSTGCFRPAAAADQARWMALAEMTADGSPCLEAGEHEAALATYLARGGAWVYEVEGVVVGALLLGPGWDGADFWAVHPQYRRQGGQSLFLAKVRQAFFPGRPLALTTFRAEDRADTGYRETLLRLGFVPQAPLTEFGYPTQRLVLPGRGGGL